MDLIQEGNIGCWKRQEIRSYRGSQLASYPNWGFGLIILPAQQLENGENRQNPGAAHALFQSEKG
jgi:hypothetical protein